MKEHDFKKALEWYDNLSIEKLRGFWTKEDRANDAAIIFALRLADKVMNQGVSDGMVCASVKAYTDDLDPTTDEIRNIFKSMIKAAAKECGE